MTTNNLTEQWKKGCSPCAIQRKYSLTYAQGYELAERLKRTQELELENNKLKELLKECKPYVMRNVVFTTVNRAEVVDLEKNELLTKIDEALK